MAVCFLCLVFCFLCFFGRSNRGVWLIYSINLVIPLGSSTNVDQPQNGKSCAPRTNLRTVQIQFALINLPFLIYCGVTNLSEKNRSMHTSFFLSTAENISVAGWKRERHHPPIKSAIKRSAVLINILEKFWFLLLQTLHCLFTSKCMYFDALVYKIGKALVRYEDGLNLTWTVNPSSLLHMAKKTCCIA